MKAEFSAEEEGLTVLFPELEAGLWVLTVKGDFFSWRALLGEWIIEAAADTLFPGTFGSFWGHGTPNSSDSSMRELQYKAIR